MKMRGFWKILMVSAAGLLLSPLFALYAQEPEKAREEPADSIVWLISARSARQIQSQGRNLRKIVGPARFLHNNTYLLCDTALWNVESKVIDAIGHVSIIQEGTVLTSDKMVYYSDRDLAEFRGHLVQLIDSDNNTLRTKNLDYNTKDSVAVFFDGGSMRDKEGQIIESDRGTYDSKIKMFTFTDNVNMFTDSIFVKTASLVYESDREFATFGKNTDMWKDDNMLSSNAGWYNRLKELFFFNDDVHVMTDTQEGWSDSLYFYRNTSNVDMLGNAQVTDESRDISSVAGRIEYLDSLRKVTMTRSPAVITEMDGDDGAKDSVFFAADTIIYRTLKYCDIDSCYLVDASKRLEELAGDPVTAYRRKAAEEAARAAEEAAKNDPNYRPPQSTPKKPDAPAPAVDTLAVPVVDSLAVSAVDSLAFAVDSLLAMTDIEVVEQPDTTDYGFLTALRNVRIFRRNMQIVCDSLEYSDVDSLARFFVSPSIWNDKTHQYNADSLCAVIRNNAMEKVHLMSEAFVHIQEDATHFDQIRGTEMIAYFDSTGVMKRFDALGGASGLFFLEENDALATANKKEAKMLSADFVDGEIEKIRYYDAVKSDAHPVAQMAKEDLILKGFRWEPERRPVSRYAVTDRKLRPVQREEYESRPRAEFVQTEQYFPGYMSDIYVQIAVRDSLARVRAQRREQEAREAAAAVDTVAVRDSVAVLDSLGVRDSVDVALDSLRTAVDSLAVKDSLGASAPSARDLKKIQRAKAAAERKAAHEAKVAAREAKWDAKDKREAEKAAAKQEKKNAKLRERKRKMIAAAEKQDRKDAAVRDRYLRRMEARQAKKSARKHKEIPTSASKQASSE